MLRRALTLASRPLNAWREERAPAPLALDSRACDDERTARGWDSPRRRRAGGGGARCAMRASLAPKSLHLPRVFYLVTKSVAAAKRKGLPAARAADAAGREPAGRQGPGRQRPNVAVLVPPPKHGTAALEPDVVSRAAQVAQQAAAQLSARAHHQRQHAGGIVVASDCCACTSSGTLRRDARCGEVSQLLLRGNRLRGAHPDGLGRVGRDRCAGGARTPPLGRPCWHVLLGGTARGGARCRLLRHPHTQRSV